MNNSKVEKVKHQRTENQENLVRIKNVKKLNLTFRTYQG